MDGLVQSILAKDPETLRGADLLLFNCAHEIAHHEVDYNDMEMVSRAANALRDTLDGLEPDR